MGRLAPSEENWTKAQRDFASSMRSSARGKIGEPFLNLLALPELAERVAAIGATLRFDGVLPSDIRELVVLTVAEHCQCGYEWQGHATLAAKAGIGSKIIAAVGLGQRPAPSTIVQQVAWESTHLILQDGRLSDPAFKRLIAAFGREGAVELVTLCGYYNLLAWIINAGRTDAEQPSWDEVVADQAPLGTRG